ncbi:MAG TPA: ABC transporter ATP-binding protein [Bacilli bacterium]|nr:MAG: putative ABC transporter ATP-binding protein [Tenericutes bacterium ADurb.BinA124]HNZ49926.1 ABC transporter ATP-binding protein [Bacilli bacterium]HPX84196.1 ABC transporter ATP-binding protein [Bacilli bacterium]HQC74155.1 ABC transporter ATP-binding protein [Bacilli bacterium]
MDEEVTKVNLTDKKIIKRLISYAKNHKKAFAIAVLLMVFAVGIDLVLPLLLGLVSKILGRDNIDFQQIIGIVVIYGCLLVVMFIIQFYQAMTLQKAGQKIIYEVREQVFTHIEKYSIAQINSVPVGKFVTRVTNDTNTLNEMYTSVVINLLKDSFTIIGVLVAMFFVDTSLSLYVLAVCPLIVIISFVFRKYSREAYREVRSNIANVNAFLSENISGMKITQVFNQEAKKLQEFQEKNKQLKKSSLKQIFIFGIFRPSIYVLYIATVMLILWFGSNNVILQAGLTFEVIIIFHQYIDRLFNPIQQLAEQFNILQSAFAASEKIFAVLDQQPEIVDAPDAIELSDVKGEIEFKNVWFSYLPDEWVLKDVSFKIKANETVAFVGATGSGKTTILSLIVRNYDIQKGQILIDGIDIRKIKIASLRSQIGQMLQDVFLFSGTINSNIKMREDSITDDDVKQACEYVNADKFINSLPNAYQEEVRERGNNFSAGQRQLLSFARTMAHQPKVMILDEATANIDTETEVLIQDSLAKMMNVGTMLVVAHRLSTIQHADKIIVLQKGEIVEEGNHQELLKKRGQYYKLYQLQYQHQ